VAVCGRPNLLGNPMNQGAIGGSGFYKIHFG
jgi:hypothetical protein